MAPSLNGLTEKATSTLELVSVYLAQASGAFFGVIQGFFIISKTLLDSVLQLKSSDGRKQIYYGRQGGAEGKSGDFYEETSEAVGHAKDKLSNATANISTQVRSSVSKGANSVSKASSKVTNSSSSSSTSNGISLPTSQHADPAPSPPKPPQLTDLSEAVALGPGAPLPPIKEVKASAQSKTVHEDPQKGKTVKKASASTKGNGDHLDPAPKQGAGTAEARLPVEYEDSQSEVSTGSLPGSPRSTGAEAKPKRAKKIVRRLKSAFTSGKERGN